VVAARERQAERLRGNPATCNGDMGGPLTRRMVRLGAVAAQRLRQGQEQLGLSARGHDRVLRIARTIADLEGRETVEAAHVDEALGYRMSASLSEAA
jgi:magnesium chelatase family protein